MLLLAFDTAQGALSVAITENGLLRARRFELRGRGHAEALMPMLVETLREADAGFEDLGALAVTVGPGTFTGLRAGLAAARGIALARGLPLIGVTTLQTIAAPVRAMPHERIVAVFDARRDELYIQLFESGGEAASEPLLLKTQDARDLVAGSAFVVTGTGSDFFLDLPGARLSDTGAQPDALHVAQIAEAELVRLGADHFRTAPAPLYLRLPDAKLPGGLSLEAASTHKQTC